MLSCHLALIGQEVRLLDHQACTTSKLGPLKATWLLFPFLAVAIWGNALVNMMFLFCDCSPHPQMTNPGIQNDFSYYRRTQSRTRMQVCACALRTWARLLHIKRHRLPVVNVLLLLPPDSAMITIMYHCCVLGEW